MKRFSLILMLLLAAVAASPALAAEEETPAKEGPRSWLGVWLGDAVDGGVQIVALVPQGPADRAGLRSGDIILRANGKEVSDQGVFNRLLAGLKPGDSLDLDVLRAGETVELPVELGDWEFRISARVAVPSGGSAPVVKLNIPRSYRLESFLQGDLLGMQVAEITPMLREHFGAPGEAGVLIVRVDPDKPGGEAGMEVGDILVSINGQEISGRSELEERLLTWEGKDPLQLQIIRESEPRVVNITSDMLESRSEATPAAEGNQATRDDMVLVRKRIEAEIKTLERRLTELQRILDELQQRQSEAPE